MPYKLVPIRQGGRIEHYQIVDEDSFGPEARVTPNLGKNEKMINWLFTRACPVTHPCIYLANGVSIICENLRGEYLFNGYWRSGVHGIVCEHDDSEILLKISLLQVEDCPNNQPKCNHCHELKDITPRPGPSKSHAYIVCTNT